MADPIFALGQRFEAALAAALGAEHAKTDPALRRSVHADYQANVAMALGKRLGRPPREVAQAIVDRLDVADLCTRVELAGPGFINLHLRDETLARELTDLAQDARLGVPSPTPETVVIDYSSPNVAKEMHVGHLRSTVIGDALARTLEALGHRLIRQNHLGDWGTPFGMLIEHLLDRSAESGAGEAGSDAAAAIADLDGFYREARAKFDADPAFAERSRRRVVLLQGGDEATLGLWRRLVATSTRYFSVIYRSLGITLTEQDHAGESRYNPELRGVIEELSGKGLVTESEGALCVFPPGFTGKEGQPLPLIVRKQDGGYGYATTDLAAVRYRLRDLGATRLLYVVGAPQSQHFAMVFEAARQAGWLAPPARAEHVAFGSVLGPDKKMFKTRSGETVKLAALIDEAAERATKVVTEKNPDLDPETTAAVGRAIGIGAVKYADLSSDRIKDYIFDWGRMLAFEGNTAPYLMYAHARIRSIFRKAEGEGESVGAIVVKERPERALALELLRFGTVVSEVGDTLEPHRLCGYLFDLAGAFTSFYEQCPVLKAPEAATRGSRLALCNLTARVLARGLSVLGIEAPERM
ncbi:arginine--tRNA ligase [Chondromyces apiculatus]|uniref:Arginine--tRNA ligase n=1 Tax=Chondromyces apiculatus DSM 436 TaxID=1192034 RepID=A0A017STQ8_9BACT|nr:arginine--tRNA ligase [Chondromyces apiculatus]EYF00142.1 Arginyl-tRNA synthetase [Chondromyces apiculatus DSM 436]